MTCKQCKHLDVRPDKRGRRVVRYQTAYPCLATLLPLPVMPASIPDYVRRRIESEYCKQVMEGDDGEGCPLFAPLVPA